MRPRYAVVNEKERYEFENEWQMPYGYASSNLFEDYDQAKNYYDDLRRRTNDEIVLEEYNNGMTEVIFTT